ncbi:CLUMA_CG007227, isoform A [Clunio marinus]|uniref:CLUMA_CG007227, isoform A n=1 Tax=Clunio marinus TaxID=568069 RepID=A0A1J1I0I0_9DIPT|nr:CLUMA_CG007227, isoform A [Clunio marinus]
MDIPKTLQTFSRLIYFLLRIINSNVQSTESSSLCKACTKSPGQIVKQQLALEGEEKKLENLHFMKLMV